jgi:hypothetical protein
MDVSCQFHAPSAFAPGRDPPQPFKGEAGADSKLIRRLKNERVCCTRRELKHDSSVVRAIGQSAYRLAHAGLCKICTCSLRVKFPRKKSHAAQYLL